MTTYFGAKFVHVVGAAVLFARASASPSSSCWCAPCARGDRGLGSRTVVIADFIFTGTAVIAQPIRHAARVDCITAARG